MKKKKFSKKQFKVVQNLGLENIFAEKKLEKKNNLEFFPKKHFGV